MQPQESPSPIIPALVGVDKKLLPVNRLVHVESGIVLTELREQLFALREACDRIERGEIIQDFEFGRATSFIRAKAIVVYEFELWLTSSRSLQVLAHRETVWQPVSESLNLARKLLWRVWDRLPNLDNGKIGASAELASNLARLRRVAGICAIRLEDLGSQGFSANGTR